VNLFFSLLDSSEKHACIEIQSCAKIASPPAMPFLVKGKIILIGSLVQNLGREIAIFFHNIFRKGVLLGGVAGI
jgi:hypothetical protein